MFGYIRICKDELKVREFNLFQSYYCGLCKTLKREYGFASRMGLSYDVTFLALLLSSITEDKTKVCPERCIANPLRKRPVAVQTDYLEYTAAVNVILICAKLKDDWRDERSVKALLSLPLFMRARRKVKKLYPELLQAAERHLLNLSRLERDKCSEIDRLANEFGMIMQSVFDAPILADTVARRILAHMGYGLGRFVYIMDAYEDREKDAKGKNFNPFLLSREPVHADQVKNSLLFTLSDVSNSYQLLNIKSNRPILDNIIYLGLPESLEKVFGSSLAIDEGEQKS